jgi:U3 small nucleolar RNA-associated protein MPP10
VALEEMPRGEKLRARRRQKARRKAKLEMSKAGHKKIAEKHELVSELKRGKVKIVGERGEMRKIGGHVIMDSDVHQASGVFKL